MQRLWDDYERNVEHFASLTRERENFDLVRRRLSLEQGELSLFYIDGFIKDATMQKLMQYFLDRKTLTESASLFADRCVPYVEVDTSGDFDFLLLMVLSGAAVMFGSSFGDRAVVIDART